MSCVCVRKQDIFFCSPACLRKKEAAKEFIWENLRRKTSGKRENKRKPEINIFYFVSSWNQREGRREVADMKKEKKILIFIFYLLIFLLDGRWNWNGCLKSCLERRRAGKIVVASSSWNLSLII